MLCVGLGGVLTSDKRTKHVCQDGPWPLHLLIPPLAEKSNHSAKHKSDAYASTQSLRQDTLSPCTPMLTKGHDGEVFAPEFAGDLDLLTQCPAMFGLRMVRGSRRVMAHLEETRFK